MAFKRIRLMEIWEILRRWHDGQTVSTIAARIGCDRKTVRTYIRLACNQGGDSPERPGTEGRYPPTAFTLPLSSYTPKRPSKPSWNPMSMRSSHSSTTGRTLSSPRRLSRSSASGVTSQARSALAVSNAWLEPVRFRLRLTARLAA